MRISLMSPVLPPGLTEACNGRPLARALAVAVLAVPLLVVAVALVPAFVVCPFLGAGRQRLLIRLLAGLAQWAAALVGPG
jgi:hypothetical protein